MSGVNRRPALCFSRRSARSATRRQQRCKLPRARGTSRNRLFSPHEAFSFNRAPSQPNQHCRIARRGRGVRISECLGIRWRHVLWDENKISIEQVFRHGQILNATTRYYRGSVRAMKFPRLSPVKVTPESVVRMPAPDSSPRSWLKRSFACLVNRSEPEAGTDGTRTC